MPGELVFVMEMRGDGQHRLLEDDKLILAEVRIASASLRTSKMNRIVLWSRLLMQRPQAFVLLRMDEFCARRGTRECILLHNSRVWTKDDTSSHRMENGDFLMIEAFVDDLSLTEAWNELKRYEEHECNRRLFTTSSEAQIGGEQNAACSQEGEALGSEEDSPRDFSPSGEAANAEDEDFSLVSLRSTERTFSEASFLLQIRVRRFSSCAFNSSYFLFWDSFSELSPPGNPSEWNALPAPSACTPERSSVEEENLSHKLDDVSFVISDDEVEPGDVQAGGFERRVHNRPGDWDFVKLFQTWNDSPLRMQLPDDIELAPIALHLVADSFVGWSSEIEEVHIYTDGSYDPKEEVSSFAFAVFGWSGSRPKDKSFFLGWLAGVVCTDVNAPQYLSASQHSVGSAEASALMWAHNWYLQSGLTTTVFFHYGSMVVGHGASGLWQINEKNLQVKKLRSLVHLGDSLHKGQKVYEHVKAHSGCPNNGTGGRHCLRHPEQHVLHGFPSWQPIFQEGHDALQWAWWHVSVLRGDCYHPSGDADGVKWRQGDRGVEVFRHFEH